ncbi:MAG TPA: tRNA lysidine(34) synthetase TilS [Chthoniobacterales bacterium]|nr:tRNA lysidine(34) synthetase TilS [Chthoniobacterales bacterium]
MNRIQFSNGILRRFPARERYLVGVSGGCDSVALLHLLIDFGYKNLVVCHLNHRLRGRSADADARFVQKLVAFYSSKIVGQAHRPPNRKDGKRSARPTTPTAHVDLEMGTVDVRALAAKRKMSTETAAREARYAFFARAARRRRCQTIFLAHHADDLVETFLLNLFRGAGMTGLAAMRELSVRQISDIELTIVRPLLSVWRTQIDDYARKHRLKFREDASNKDLALARNRIRHRVVPYLERTLGREIRQSIWRAANIAAHEEAWIDRRMPESSEADLAVAKLRELPVALQRRAIVNWLRSRDIKNVGFDVVEAVRLLLEPDVRVAKINLPQDRHVRRRAGKIFVE